MEDTLKEWLKQLKLHESTISMVLGALVVVIVGTLLYQYFNRVEDETIGQISNEGATEYTLKLAEEEEGKFVPTGLPLLHVVKAGEHLWSISTTYYGNGYNWVDIAKANLISDPGLIEVGQQLSIPRVELRVPPDEGVIAASSTANDAINDTSYVVVKGDTLWDIAVRAYQDGYRWVEIYQTNNQLISDPNLIEVDMVITIPRNP